MVFIAGAFLLLGYPIDKKMEQTIESDLKKRKDQLHQNSIKEYA
jgi:Na+/melibiose symporter-like transporter